MTTVYPAQIDDNSSLPSLAGVSDTAVAVNALKSAVIAIETELGLEPKGVYQDVRTRLDILETRMGTGGGGGGGGSSSDFVRVETSSSNYVVQTVDSYVLSNSSGGSRTITLPSSPTSVRQLILKRRGVNSVLISGNGNTIDGASSITLLDNYEVITVVWGGAEWEIIG